MTDLGKVLLLSSCIVDSSGEADVISGRLYGVKELGLIVGEHGGCP